MFQENGSKDNPRHLIPELCRELYYTNGFDNGWLTGGRGGISIKYK